jgi:hypothetical protein
MTDKTRLNKDLATTDAIIAAVRFYLDQLKAQDQRIRRLEEQATRADAE